MGNPGSGNGAERADVEVWLLGQPLLREYLDFVKDAAVGGESADMIALADEWRRANDYYARLERQEAGIADEVQSLDLDSSYLGWVEQVTRHPSFRNTFDVLPTRFGLVELDKLVVYQKSVTMTFVEALAARLGPDPSAEALARTCLPLDPANAPVEVRRLGSRRYSFRSDSTDLRYHQVTMLKPEQLAGYASFGPIAGVVGVVVGYGANFLSVVRADDRLLLHNGYHRACALRSLGVTHAPAVIQTVTRPDELELVGKKEVAEDPAFYLEAARPPLLKDFFDPRIAKAMPVRRQVRQIDVTVEVHDALVSE